MLAKGKVYVSKEKLADLLSLPEGVEVIAIKPKEHEEAFEFLVISAEETVATKKGVSIGGLRRISVETLEQFRYGKSEKGGYVGSASVGIANLTRKETILSNDEAEKLLDEDMISKILRTIRENYKDGQNDTQHNITINVVKQDEKDVQKVFESISQGLKKKGIK